MEWDGMTMGEWGKVRREKIDGFRVWVGWNVRKWVWTVRRRYKEEGGEKKASIPIGRVLGRGG